MGKKRVLQIFLILQSAKRASNKYIKREKNRQVIEQEQTNERTNEQVSDRASAFRSGCSSFFLNFSLKDFSFI